MSIASLTRLVTAAALLVGLWAAGVDAAGTASNNKGKIEGTKWTSQAATIKGAKIPAGALKLTFGKDGSLVYTAGPQKFTGKYVLEAGNTVTFKLDQNLGGSKEHKETISVVGNKLTMTDSDGTSLSFDKAK